MEKRTLGNSDMEITTIGYGSWAIGGPGWEFGWGPQDDSASIESIHRALDLGMNWIDTAAAYGLGHSEELVARAVEGWSGSRPYVFTKCGLRWDEQGKTTRTLKYVKQECEESLRRLRVDAIDLYQIHWPTKDPVENEAGWRAMAELQREGKVRWIALSNWNVEQMEMARAIAPVTALQPPYSLINRDVEKEILPYCERHGIGVIVYSPMASGLLSGAMTRERAASLPESDWRSRSENFREPKLTANLALVERLRAVGERHGRSPGEVAIAWTLARPAVTGAIVGARDARQVEGVIGAGELRLTAEEIAEIESPAA